MKSFSSKKFIFICSILSSIISVMIIVTDTKYGYFDTENGVCGINKIVYQSTNFTDEQGQIYTKWRPLFDVDVIIRGTHLLYNNKLALIFTSESNKQDIGDWYASRDDAFFTAGNLMVDNPSGECVYSMSSSSLIDFNDTSLEEPKNYSYQEVIMLGSRIVNYRNLSLIFYILGNFAGALALIQFILVIWVIYNEKKHAYKKMRNDELPIYIL